MLGTPSLNIRTIHRDQVRLGMFVHSFDGSWFSHPFWRSRFLITTHEQLETILSADIQTLAIDVSRGLPLIAEPAEPTPRAATLRAVVRQASRSTRRTLTPASDRLVLAGNVDGERERMRAVFAKATKVMRTLMSDVAHGRTIHSIEVAPLVGEIGDSIESSPHALVGLTRIRTKDEYTFVHSVAVCALMITLGRRLGLDAAMVRELGIAGLLHDVGKMAIPDGMLKKPDRLTDDEFALVRTHPEQGYLVLLQSSDASETVLSVARHHHERMDGTGYPHRLSGDQLPLAVRIAAICDVFDAITADRPYKRAWTPTEAISRMQSWHGHFDRDLLFAFMQALDVYPPGMLVKLRSNRLAIVLEASRRNSTPKVRAFLSTIDRLPFEPVDVALGCTLAQDQILSEENPTDWGIDDWSVIAEQVLTRSGRWGKSRATQAA